MRYVRIPGFLGYSISREGSVWSDYVNRPLKPFTDSGGPGYVRVGLLRDGKQRLVGLHRLLAIVFLPGYHPSFQVNHKNGVKTDNRLENLEWCTPKYNLDHARSTGLRVQACGEAQGNSKLTAPDVRKIRELFRGGLSQNAIARSYGVSRGCICGITQGLTWVHVV